MRTEHHDTGMGSSTTVLDIRPQEQLEGRKIVALALVLERCGLGFGLDALAFSH